MTNQKIQNVQNETIHRNRVDDFDGIKHFYYITNLTTFQYSPIQRVRKFTILI